MSTDFPVKDIVPVHKRAIHSFVKRKGRQSDRQKQALQQYWPEYGIEYSNALLDFSQLFPDLSVVKLEIGFGNGESLVQMAKLDDSSGYIGIEVHTPGVGNCLNLIHDQQLSNLGLMTHDAIEVLQSMIPPNSLSAVFLFFPDPWHKKRHNKRRIVNNVFKDLLIKVLKPGAVLHMATDWQDYAEHMAQEMLADSRFRNLGNELGYSEKPDYRPITKFERRGLRLGHGVWDLMFEKR